jgi:hypothetical protein
MIMSNGKQSVLMQKDENEKEIYYFLSDLDALPESYTPDWPTSFMR